MYLISHQYYMETRSDFESLDLVRQFFDGALERLLNFFDLFFVFGSGNETNCVTFGEVSTSSSDSVHILFVVVFGSISSRSRHVEVDDKVDSGEIHTSSEQVSGDQDSFVLLFELVVGLVS